MDVEDLKNIYLDLDKITLSLKKDADFDYIQSQTTKVALFSEEINQIISKLLVAKTTLEHLLTDLNFEYELKFTDHLVNNPVVKGIPTGKERKDYINCILLKEEYKRILDLQLESKDLDSLILFAKKKSKDLDKYFSKLQTLWDSVQSELKYIKKIGSDSEHLDKVRSQMQDSNPPPKKYALFEDEGIDEISNNSFDKPLSLDSNIGEETNISKYLDNI